MCAYGNVTDDTGMACSGDSGGPMVVRENERSPNYCSILITQTVLPEPECQYIDQGIVEN